LGSGGKKGYNAWVLGRHSRRVARRVGMGWFEVGWQWHNGLTWLPKRGEAPKPPSHTFDTKVGCRQGHLTRVGWMDGCKLGWAGMGWVGGDYTTQRTCVGPPSF
jgi:hypothetical protein